MSIVTLGLIGVGVHATFTSSTSSGQTITAGTWGVTLSGSCINGTTCPLDPSSSDLFSLSHDGTTLTFTPYAASTSSFSTGDQEVTATSTGNIQLTDPTWLINVTGGSDLASQAFVCATSTGIGTDVTNTVLYNGPLGLFTRTSYSLPSDVLSTTGPLTTTSGPTDNLVVDVYAGSESTLCGSNITPGTPATPGISTTPSTISGAAIGESIAVTVQLTYQD
ncbi:MAG TPA: SipW-dependent-type signal peptide-containing protein [Acidimicrobiales bacterium]|nr:SipW-dependent-type signal peptide-containing protein [Acidimicrobiales bacterium]